MLKIRYGIMVLVLLFCLTPPATAQVSVSIGLPHVSIGINLPGYPVLAPVPGYPVYYAPGIEANYFFYDGYYWVYQNDYWYASDWYNGPWWVVEPDFVPLFILRIPVVYYRHPPAYFYGWHAYEPPRWGQHWGHDWERRHGDWKHWQRDRTPAPAPRPDYQRGYYGQRYPQGEQQQNLHRQHYRYQPRDTQVREYVQPRVERKGSPPDQRGQRGEPDMRSPGPQQSPRPAPSRQGGWSGPQSQPAPQQSQEQRRPSGQERQKPEVQERERDRQSGDYRSRDQGQKAPEGRDYERYGRGQGRDKEREQGSGWGKENKRGND